MLATPIFAPVALAKAPDPHKTFNRLHVVGLESPRILTKNRPGAPNLPSNLMISS